jgi:hypothetical protein
MFRFERSDEFYYYDDGDYYDGHWLWQVRIVFIPPARLFQHLRSMWKMMLGAPRMTTMADPMWLDYAQEWIDYGSQEEIPF